MGLFRRAVALLLAVALPAVVGARLALDIRSAPHAYPHVETKHGEACADGHDHTLCVLVFATPWADAAPAPQVELSALPEFVPPFVAYRCEYEAQIRLALARAPPSFIPLA
jgi:hypothetical protein